MRIAAAAAVALAVFAAGPGSAQQSSDLHKILAQMPKKLGGAPVRQMPEGIVMYFLRGPSGEPMVVGLSVAENEEEFPSAEIRSRLHGSGILDIRQILREGTFTTPKWPGASTYFMDFVGSEFRHQNWHLMSGKVGITVQVTYDSKKDANRAQALVAKEIFGGAVVSAAKPAE
jgi:hypothetical protein